MGYDEKLWEERHTKITDRLNNHGIRLSALELDNRELKTEIKNLLKSVNSLVSTLKWGFGIILTAAGIAVALYK